MEQHPQLLSRAVELGPNLTIAERQRLWQQLADALNAEGPAHKKVDMWQEWGCKQVHDACHDSAAVTEVQRRSGRGRAPGFRGPVLQLTGTLRLTGVTDLPFQETLHRIELSTTRLAVAVERTAAAQEGILRELRHLARALREREN
ncbi:hypothetical protein MTO96_028809 [Rhipicephalus appendiculatus]